MRIAVVAPGEMGAAIGVRLRRGGAEVTTSLLGRGEASAARARKAGLIAVEDDERLVAGADLLLSIVPPAQALPLARRFAPALARSEGRVTFADCNAIAPETMQTIAGLIAGAGCPAVDVGIIGGPPGGTDAGPRLYAAGEAAAALVPLRDLGLDLRPLEGGIGAASALKMAYATLTKGLTALGAAMALEAAAGGVEAALLAELAASQPALLTWLRRQLPAMPPKAYRWLAEMEEIARTLETAGLPDAAPLFTGAAGLYAGIADDQAGKGKGELATLTRFFAPSSESQ